MKAEPITRAWQLYEAGKEYKRRTGLYETVRRNERFYRGDQWSGGNESLPKPVFNLIRRIVDHLIGSITPGEPVIRYTDDRLPFLDTAELRERVSAGISLLNRHAAYRWDHNRMSELTQRALLDAAISGDGIFYCWWDDSCNCGQPFCGDIRTDLIRNTAFFPADPNSTDVQSQDYLILSGRASVTSLRAEAIEAGMSPKEAEGILPDSDVDAADLSSEADGKATYLLYFYRKNGEVVFEKSTKTHLIRSSETGMRYYPVAYFNWFPTQNSCHGASPVSELVPNQQYVNSAYAMAMKHMSDTAFSKVVYDQSRIPEWTNEVGQAIAAMGGGNVSDAVSVVGVGQLQDNYLELIDSVVEQSKKMMGATESAVGEGKAHNTSAILALQSASRTILRQVEARLDRCLGELASIWADMLCAYSHPERLITVIGEDGVATARRIDYPLLRRELLHATAETGRLNQFTPAATVSVLDHLLDGGHITIAQYLEHLPDGCLHNKNALLQSIEKKGD